MSPKSIVNRIKKRANQNLLLSKKSQSDFVFVAFETIDSNTGVLQILLFVMPLLRKNSRSFHGAARLVVICHIIMLIIIWADYIYIDDCIHKRAD